MKQHKINRTVIPALPPIAAHPVIPSLTGNLRKAHGQDAHATKSRLPAQAEIHAQSISN